jgi:hypothetical protein
MAPPKTYMIPLQFPAGLYDSAKPPGPFAQWTSDPTYSYEEFARSNPRPERAQRKGRAKRNGGGGMPHPYDVPENAGPFWPDAYPYGAKGRPMAYGPTARELAAAKGNPKTVDPAWKAAAERLLEKRKGKTMDDFSYRAFLRAVIQGAMPVTHKDGIPYIGALEARQDLIDEYGKGPARKNPRSPGKYADVQMRYGRAGFGLPEKAPHEGSFPLYPIKRARYALALVAAPAFDGHPAEREQVIRAAVKAHPELISEAKNVLARVGMRLGKRAAANGRARKNGPTLDQPHYPFAAMEKRYISYSDAELHYALLDAREAAKHEDAMAKEGHGLSRYGWYADDVHTINAEINKRKRRK